MKKHIVRQAFAVLMLSGIVFAATPATVLAATAAQTSSTSTTNSTNTLKISPVRTDVIITAGTSAQVKTRVTNLTDAPITLHPIQNDFVAGDENGTPSIILDENSYAPAHSLKRFMVPINDFTVPAKSTKEVAVTITVPKSAQAGGYYGAIRFAPASPAGSKSVNLSTSVASLVLMSVPGPVTEKLILTNFDVQQKGEKGANFRTPENLSVLVRFKNQGNIQQQPYGQINVQKGDKIIYTSNFNQTDPKDTILPDSARRWDVPLKSMGKFGKYTISGVFTYGSKNQSIDVSKTIWIIPTSYIIGAILAVVLLIALIVGLVMYIRSRRSRSKHRSSRGRRY